MIFLSLLIAGATLNEGLTSAKNGDYENARRILSSFTHEKPSDPGVAQARLWLARLEPNPDTARVLYLIVVSNNMQTAYADSALFEAASIDYAYGLYKQAASGYKQLVEYFSASPLLAESFYWLGLCYLVFGDKSSAETSFKKARDAGTGGFWTAQAKKELELLGSSTASANPPGSGDYAVQVGSFTEQNRAEKLLAEYKSKGRSGEIKQINIAGTTYYRVWLGPFSSESDARNYAETLKAQGAAAMVVKR